MLLWGFSLGLLSVARSSLYASSSYSSSSFLPALSFEEQCKNVLEWFTLLGGKTKFSQSIGAIEFFQGTIEAFVDPFERQDMKITLLNTVTSELNVLRDNSSDFLISLVEQMASAALGTSSRMPPHALPVMPLELPANPPALTESLKALIPLLSSEVVMGKVVLSLKKLFELDLKVSPDMLARQVHLGLYTLSKEFSSLNLSVFVQVRPVAYQLLQCRLLNAQTELDRFAFELNVIAAGKLLSQIEGKIDHYLSFYQSRGRLEPAKALLEVPDLLKGFPALLSDKPFNLELKAVDGIIAGHLKKMSELLRPLESVDRALLMALVVRYALTLNGHQI